MSSPVGEGGGDGLLAAGRVSPPPPGLVVGDRLLHDTAVELAQEWVRRQIQLAPPNSEEEDHALVAAAVAAVLPTARVKVALARSAHLLQPRVPPAAPAGHNPRSETDGQRVEVSEELSLTPDAEFDRSVAIHEASHAVTGALFGASLANAEVFREPREIRGLPAAGQCELIGWNVATREYHPLMVAAGSVGQAMALHETDRPTDAQLDQILRQQRSDYELLRSEGHVPLGIAREVRPLVSRCWPAITRLADEILARGPVRHKHVVAALGLSNNAALHPFELSGIRAGMREVPQEVAR